MTTQAPVAKGQPPPGMANLDHWSSRPVIALLATGLGSGFIRPYSGTWGSIPAVLLAWGMQRLGNDWLFVATTIAMMAVSVWVASQAEGLFGHDSGRIVIDEFAGVFICYLGLPADAWVMIPVFVLFRFFDVMKPWPCRQLERLGSGLGVTADDIAAGAYTNIAVRVVILAVSRLS